MIAALRKECGDAKKAKFEALAALEAAMAEAQVT